MFMATKTPLRSLLSGLMLMPKKPISARIDSDLIALAKKVATKENRSFNNVLETALKDYCNRKH